MRSILVFILAVLIYTTSFGQSFPGCNDLRVKNVAINTAGKLAITISNTCLTCSYGATGCIYSELKVIRTVAPFDTVAASDCWCLYWENPATNGGQQTFTINTSLSSVPPISQLRIIMPGCGCDTLTYSPELLGIHGEQAQDNYAIYPNPAQNILIVKNAGRQLKRLEIRDAVGRAILSQKDIAAEEYIDIKHYTSGLYFVTVFDGEDRPLKTYRIMKE